MYTSKLKLPVVFQKKKLRLCICVWTSMTWLRALESTLPFKIASWNSWETAQLPAMLCDNAPLTSNNLGIILCYQSFLLHCLSLTSRKLIPFLESIWFFSYDFKKLEHLFIFVSSNPASRESQIIFIAFFAFIAFIFITVN